MRVGVAVGCGVQVAVACNVCVPYCMVTLAFPAVLKVSSPRAASWKLLVVDWPLFGLRIVYVPKVSMDPPWLVIATDALRLAVQDMLMIRFGAGCGVGVAVGVRVAVGCGMQVPVPASVTVPCCTVTRAFPTVVKEVCALAASWKLLVVD